MRDLVRNDFRDALLHDHRRDLVVEEQVGLAERDRAGVLHRSRREVGDADQVELHERILDAVVAIKEFDRSHGSIEREVAERLQPRRRANADRDVVRAAADALKVADEHGHEVGRHLLRRCEFDDVLAGARRCVRDDRAVRDRRVAVVDGQRDVERRLHRRLVE